MVFSKIIQDIEDELNFMYLPGAIQYMDDTYDFAWSKAIRRFEHALCKTIETGNFEHSKLEGAIYRDTIIRLIGVYKNHKRGRKVDDFLETLQ